MALSDKNIVITPNIGTASDPKIVFSGADASTTAQNITLTTYPTNSGTLSFDGSAGQLFSITNSLSGTIFSVNDVSGIPSIEVLDTGIIKLGQYSGNILLGTVTDNGNKLQVNGSVSVTGQITSTIATGTAPFVVTSTTAVTNLSIGGNAGTVTNGVYTTTAQTLTNKSLSDSTTFFIDETDGTKKLQFQLSSITTATTRTLTIPDVSGTIITTGDTGTVTSTMIADGTIVNGDISASAAIAITKLASSTISGVSLGSSLNALTISSPLTGTSYNGSAAVSIGIPAATTSVSGYLTSTDWNTFNNKQPAGSYLTASTGVTTFGGGTTGLTPAAATSGAITLAGTLAIANGGTNSTATPTLGGVGYGTGSAHAYTTVGTVGQVLQSNAAAAPSWTTLTLENLPDAWVKKSCACATTAALTINTAQVTIDGVTLTATSRVLVKDQAAPAQNGIYTGLTTTTWVRATDADTISELAGASVNVDAGTVNGGKVFDTDLKSTDTLGTTAVSFYNFLDSSALSSTTPAALGTAAVGTSTTVARSDHVHTLPSLATLGAQAAGTYVTTVTGTAPVVSSGGTTPAISMAAATASVNGYMTSTYASKLDGIASSAIALSSAITGYASGAGTVAATDSILGAIQKLNGNTPIASSTTPAALGTAAVGTGTTFARADHVHQSPTTITGNAGTATSIAGQTTNGVLYQSGSGVTTSTAASTAAGQVLTTTTLGGAPTWVTPVSGATITDDNTTNTTQYLGMSRITSGSWTTAYIATSDLYFNPSTGTLSSVIFNSLSDRNKKTNINLINNALDIVENINGVTFDWVDSKLPSAGLIAQDVEKYLPELVTDSEGTKSLNYNGVIGVLVEAIKELKEVNKTQLIDLQKQIDELKQIVNK